MLVQPVSMRLSRRKSRGLTTAVVAISIVSGQASRRRGVQRIGHLPLSGTLVGAITSLEAWRVSGCEVTSRYFPMPDPLLLADECIPGEWFGRLESLMSDDLSPQLKHEGCFQVLCVCVARVAAAEGKKKGDLRTGSSLVQPISGRWLEWLGFQNIFFCSSGGPSRWCRQEMLCM